MKLNQLLLLAAIFCATLSCTQKEQGPGTKSSTTPAARVINGMEFVPLKLENSLEVLIISDPRFKQSSAAMAVAVGSLEDPETAAGMAHYLEHMLFLGTKEFPNHDDYSTYMEKNGGGDNAYTADDVTNYFFDVDNSALDGALHRFSRFFVSPLFDPTYVDREKNAVNSEFEKNTKNDSWRSMRFLTLQAADGHPLKKFTIGNKTTLKNVNREQVMEFYKKYYSASTMRLVVMTAQPAELVKGWVTKYFSDIPNTKAQPPQYKDEYFDPKQKARYHFVKAITDIDELSVYYNIPDTIKYWDSKPVSIITKIIGYEGKGSLLSYLKKKGWALELSVGNYFTRTLNIDITLTPEGRKNHEKVTAAIFEFIRMMNEKGYPEYLYDDEKFLQKIALDNLEPSSSSNRSAFFAKAMVDYPVDSFLEKYFLLSKYSVEDFKLFLSYLKPENAHVVVSSQNEKTNKREDIFGIQYRSEELPSATLQFVDKESTVFEYPPKNEYIPNDFTLVGKNLYGKPERSETDKAEISVRQDTELGLAKGFINVAFMSHMPITPQNHILSQLYSACKTEELKEWGYPIQEANYQYAIQPLFSDTLVVQVDGYSQHLLKVLNALVVDEKNKRKLAACKIDEALFNQLKDRLKKDYLNLDLESAAGAVNNMNTALSQDKSFHWKEYVPLIDKIKLADVEKYGFDFFKQYYVFVVGYGNLKKDALEKVVDSIYESQGAKEMGREVALEKYLRFRTLKPQSNYSAVIKGKNNNNAMLRVYQLQPWTVENHAQMLMLSQHMSQPYFSELRTNQQLGYITRAFPSFRLGYVGLMTLIQSQNHAPQALAEKSQAFIDQFMKTAGESIKEEDLKPLKVSILNELRTKPNTMNERFYQFEALSWQYRGRYDLYEQMAKVVEGMTAESFKNFVKKCFGTPAPSTLTYYYFGEKAPGDPKKVSGPTFQKATDIKDWMIINPYLSKQD